MSLELTNLNKCIAAIKDAQTIMLAGHMNPDGDSLGSVLALNLALLSINKISYPLSNDPVPETLAFLPASERISLECDCPQFDIAILCDLEGLKRLGKIAPYVAKAKKVIVIDHHIAWEELGDIRIIDPTSPATALLVYKLIKGLKVDISADIATCLLTGLVTDTGSFKFSNTTPESLEIAAELIRNGADIALINEEVYESKSFAAVKLLGIAIQNIKQLNDGKITLSHLSQNDFQTAGAADEHSEGIVSHIRSIKGTLVAALLREVGPNRVRVSLRSREPVNVASISQSFGGGGHHLAAGCSFNLSLQEAETQLVEGIRQWMASSQSINPKV